MTLAKVKWIFWWKIWPYIAGGTMGWFLGNYDILVLLASMPICLLVCFLPRFFIDEIEPRIEQ